MGLFFSSHQINSIQAKLDQILKQLDKLQQGEQKEMIALSDLAAVEAAERADLATLTGLMEQVLQKLASGQLDQTGAQALPSTAR